MCFSPALFALCSEHKVDKELPTYYVIIPVTHLCQNIQRLPDTQYLLFHFSVTTGIYLMWTVQETSIALKYLFLILKKMLDAKMEKLKRLTLQYYVFK